MKRLKVCSTAATSENSHGHAAEKFIDWCKKKNFHLQGKNRERPYVVVDCQATAVLDFIRHLSEKFDCQVIVSFEHISSNFDAELCLYDDWIE